MFNFLFNLFLFKWINILFYFLPSKIPLLLMGEHWFFFPLQFSFRFGMGGQFFFFFKENNPLQIGLEQKEWKD